MGEGTLCTLLQLPPGRARLSRAERMSSQPTRLDRVSPYQETRRQLLPLPEGEGWSEGQPTTSYLQGRAFEERLAGAESAQVRHGHSRDLSQRFLREKSLMRGNQDIGKCQ